MTASEVEAEATSTTAATAVTPIRPMTTPMSAVRIGSPAAAKAPNVTSRMRNPMAIPMTSGSSEILGTDPGYTEPENSVWTPASRDGLTAALSASRGRDAFGPERVAHHRDLRDLPQVGQRSLDAGPVDALGHSRGSAGSED